MSSLFHRQGESVCFIHTHIYIYIYIYLICLSGDNSSFLFPKIIFKTDGFFQHLCGRNKSFLASSSPAVKQVFNAAVVPRILITFFFLVKHGAILYNEAEVFSLSITNPNGRPMLPFDWLIHSSLILASCRVAELLFLCRFSAVEK